MVRFADLPQYWAVFACFWNIGDFYSDCTFVVILYDAMNSNWGDGDDKYYPYGYLFYASLAFTVIPHFLSNLLTLHFLNESRKYNIYLSKYVNRYDWLLITLSVIGGFFAAIEMCRSNLFYLSMLNLQLRKEKYDKIKSWRFWTVVCFENIPQITIQCLYIYYKLKESNDIGEQFNLILFNAMLFSILSLTFGLVWKLNKMIKMNSESNYRYTYRKKKNYRIIIGSPYVEKWHGFTRRKLEDILNQLLEIDDSNGQSIQIFYMYGKREGIVTFLEVNNLSFKLNEQDTSNATYKDIFDKFEGLFTGSPLSVNLKQDLIVKLDLIAPEPGQTRQQRHKENKLGKNATNKFAIDLNSITLGIEQIPDGLEYNRAMKKISIHETNNMTSAAKQSTAATAIGGTNVLSTTSITSPGNDSKTSNATDISNVHVSAHEHGHGIHMTNMNGMNFGSVMPAAAAAAAEMYNGQQMNMNLNVNYNFQMAPNTVVIHTPTSISMDSGNDSSRVNHNDEIALPPLPGVPPNVNHVASQSSNEQNFMD